MRFPTRKEFAKFIDEDDWSGVKKRSCFACPLAKKLRQQDPVVKVSNFTYWGREPSTRLPRWASEFISKFDASDGSQAAAREIMKELM